MDFGALMFFTDYAISAVDLALALEARLALITLGRVTPDELTRQAPEVEALAHDLGRTDVEARVLRLKAVAIGVLYGLFFAHAGQPAVTAESVAAHLQTQSGQSGGQK